MLQALTNMIYAFNHPPHYFRGYCQLKEEALDRTVWRNRFGRGFEPVVLHITDDDDDDD